jgi:hypothetical protein
MGPCPRFTPALNAPAEWTGISKNAPDEPMADSMQVKPQRVKAKSRSSKTHSPRQCPRSNRQSSVVELSSLCANPSEDLGGSHQKVTLSASQNVPDCKFAAAEKPMLIKRSFMHLIYNH